MEFSGCTSPSTGLQRLMENKFLPRFLTEGKENEGHTLRREGCINRGSGQAWGLLVVCALCGLVVGCPCFWGRGEMITAVLICRNKLSYAPFDCKFPVF